MRPTPSQKPHLLVSIIEKVEEIRLIYAEIINEILECSEEEIVLENLAEISSLIRVLLMDPFKDV